MATSKFQLTLPFAVAAPPPARPAISRTRALVDAVQLQLQGARVIITDNRSVLLSQAVRNGVRTVRA
ncbi:MAG TPA: hypothetical protein VGO62_01785, partial [Myxococcota bacterium]